MANTIGAKFKSRKQSERMHLIMLSLELLKTGYGTAFSITNILIPWQESEQ
jgi:hypothetical protein